MTVEEAIDILQRLVKSELQLSDEDRSLNCDELLAIQVLYDYAKYLELVTTISNGIRRKKWELKDQLTQSSGQTEK